MLKFTKLRLQGFKSFVDPIELAIEPGLTGVVGPNGCGKSNLVEALKWVMGETSAKQMRGSAMDDVIFGGSSDRPSRNVAEVVVHMDNAARVAPAMFNDAEELEIVRRIERDKGSNYRVNGQEVRAKDVQLLFADAASGSKSTALVSQGKIGSIISAKPQDRRMLLEEAAGITGLHSRRHEAELRLRGAETNLSRLDDILVTLESQLQSLKKQSRQATRYRNISDLINKAEAMLYHVRWIKAQEELNTNQEKLKGSQSIVAGLTANVANTTTQQLEAAEGVPELRTIEAEVAAKLQRFTLAREGLDEEANRIETTRLDRIHRLEQVKHDIARERDLAEDAAQAARKLGAEKTKIDGEREGEDEALTESERALEEASKAVAEIEAKLTSVGDRINEQDSERAGLNHAKTELTTRLERLSERFEDLSRQKSEVENEADEESGLSSVIEALGEKESARENANARLEGAESAAVAASEETDRARHALSDARVALSRIEAEEEALSQILEHEEADMWPPLMDAVSVDAGYEAALGAALGEDLNAPADEAAPVHWSVMGALEGAHPLPHECSALNRFVRAPEALSRRLSQIGVIDDDETGARLAPLLKQGQRIVSKSGALWRWDGYTVTTGAKTAATGRLEQLGRLRDVRASIKGVRENVAGVEAQAKSANDRVGKSKIAERDARIALKDSEEDAQRLRDSVAAIKSAVSERNSRLEGITQSVSAVEHDLGEARKQMSDTEQRLASMPDTEALRELVATMRSDLTGKRDTQIECQGVHGGHQRVAEERKRRLADIERELLSWSERKEGAEERIMHLEDRTREVQAELEELAKKPDEIKAKREELMVLIEESEGARKIAADQLAVAEQKLNHANKLLRESEAELAKSREDRVRIEGVVEQNRQGCDSIIERVRERLDCAPEDLPELAELKEGADLPELEQVERRVERLSRERDTMGPVNLRAEEEAREMGEQIEGLETERSDLVQAIEKLRRGINELNREGRERLLTSFHEVDKHFQELFQRLFGGGKAHLKLIEADDPLESGLEIMASPPGKRMQVLSLLSGGEQAMTATALLFAVFMTNPAPICVLDEVDAPLDDANVDRFCTLLEEMAEGGTTRFLIITHHRMTMARMDRLFGVTMGERGVSQLVSVDLEGAVELRESA